MLSRFIAPLTACALVLLVGCASSPEKHDNQASSDILTVDTILKPVAPIESGGADTGISLSSQAMTNQEPPKPELQVGTGKFFTKVPGEKAGASGEADVVFNFENQPVQAVIKAVLGDLLQENYTIASNVGGNVTFSTAKPIRRSEALSVLETLLAANGISLVRDNNRYSVVLTKDAIAGRLSPTTLPTLSAKGYELRIFPLQYVSPSEMAKLLKPYAKPEAFINIDPNRSLLVMAGTSTELANYQQTIQTFDVDWLKGMSIGVYTLQHVDVTKLLPDLLKIFGTEGESPLAGMFRFMPIDQTNSLVVITPQPEYLKSAEEWLYRLDRGGAENATQLYVYNVKNLKAPDLADYLSQVFLGASTGTSHRSTTGSVAPGLRPTTLGTRGASGGGGGSTLSSPGNTTMSYQNSLRPQSTSEKNTPGSTTPGGTTPSVPGQGNKESDIRISAIEENNQLMIQATPIEWSRIEAAIKKLDIIPLQVQIEARILEVRLTGNLNFGVQWYLNGLIGTATGSAQENGQYTYPGFTGNSHDRHRLSLGATGNAGPTSNGGFFYSFLSNDFEVAINALETNGQAKSLAAPSLLVANNQEAQINVGTQIPVVQTYYSGLGTVSNTNGTTSLAQTGTVQYLNTGVTLDVKPRVNPGGLVYLDIQQEVSNPGPPATTGGNPPINQRLIQTQVAVQSGETLLLGGLIQDNQTSGQTGLPLISKVPFLRNLFGNTTNSNDRTELIVLITPRVIRNSEEGRQVTEEYTRQFQSLAPMRGDMAPHTPPPPPPPAATEPVQPQEGTPNGH